MINVNGNLAKGLNSEKIKKAKGIYSFPAFVPQFKDGGEVYKDGGGVKQRLAKAAPNLADQSRQLRYNVQNPPGQTFIKPQTSPAMEPIKVGPRSDYVGSALQRGPGLAPNVVDSQMVGNMAHNLAQNYNGPYQDKVKGMFPAQTGASRPGSLAQRVLGYKDGGEVEPMLEKDQYGMIEGPGTGTSDDIPAELEEGDYIIPAAAVEKFGADNLMRLIHAVMGEEMMEGDMEGMGGGSVEAMVSNGEIRVPREVVEKLGPGFFDAIKAASNVNSTNKMKDGKPAYEGRGLVEDYEESRNKGFGILPSAAKSYTENVINPTRNAIENIGNTISSGVKNAGNELLGTPKQSPSLAQPNNALSNFQASNAATSNRLQNEARGVNLAQPAISDKVDPNIYGPEGVNYGPNPSKEQVNQLFAPNLAEKGPSELDKYKQFLQAQSEAQSAFNDRERTQNEILYRNYGTALPGGERLDYGAGFTPAQLNTQQNIAGLNAQTELAKTNTLADVERYRANQPQYDVRINDEGEPVYFQKSGIGVENQGNQQQINTRLINAKKYLQDPRSTAEQKQSALEYYKSLGLL